MPTESNTSTEAQNQGVSAWMMQIDRMLNLAVGQFEIVHIVDQPELFLIPQAPEYCKHVIIWNENIVPVMNVSSWLSNEAQAKDTGIIAILVYKNSRQELQYGGIKLGNAPALEKVTNSQQCELPEDNEKLRGISLSCFKSSGGETVPVLDVEKLFSRGV